MAPEFAFHFQLLSISRVDKKNIKNEINKEMSNIGNEAKSFLDRFFGDVSKSSATKQILIGAGSGW
jgi:FUN14 domain-containing protein 1